MPDELLFTQPQWNTWIELTYNQNEADILTYARSILKHGFSPGVLMIDDTWQEAYGVWDFHPGRFTNPKALIDSLHEMGFKVMLWICPFVSADSPPYRELKAKNALLAEAGSASKPEPAMVRWWNGASAVLDFTAPEAVSWFNAQLERLQKDYAIDGFKFDAGDTPFYTGKVSSRQNISANTHTELFGQFGLKYPLNEYRAMWKRGGQPIAERIADKFHSWEDLQKLVPQVVLQGLEGYSFTCPDMIGGGDYISFLNLKTLDQDLVVRSAQCHALMPMMQFSVAPWRILDAPHLEAVKKSVALRSAMTPKILALAKQSAKTGEPIVKSLEYVFPSQGFATVKDQFMLGDKIMVAPLTEKGKTSRVILIPKGKWKSDEGKIIKGPVKLRVEVPVDRLPYFELMK
jgi:alpha-glucosidase